MADNVSTNISPEDLYQLKVVSNPEISPDGSQVAYCVLNVSKEALGRLADIWLVPTAGGLARRLTSGGFNTMPRWSPSGKEIAFLSLRGPGNMQLCTIPMSGGDARPLTDMNGSIGSFQWSPEGRQIVLAFRKEGEGPKVPVVRLITRLVYKDMVEGFLPTERYHIWLVDAATGGARQLTEGDDHQNLSPCWSPDGREIAFISNRSPEPDLTPYDNDIYMMKVSDGDLRKLETPQGQKDGLSYSPDGRWLAYYCDMDLVDIQYHKEKRQPAVWIVPADGTGKAQKVTEPFDVEVGNWILSDVAGILIAPTTPPTWSQDSGLLYFEVDDHGKQSLVSIAVGRNGSKLETIVGDKGAVVGFTLDKKGERLAYIWGDEKNPADVWVRDMTTGKSCQLTGINADLLSARKLGEIEEVRMLGPSGNELQGWVLKPPDFDETKKYPLVLLIHGAPTQWGYLFTFHSQFLAANGYVVTYCNPRGSMGYGKECRNAVENVGPWACYDDLMAWVDAFEKKPYVDRERMGVSGISYGGYMSNWIIGHTNRFKAAVPISSLSNWVSWYGTLDLWFIAEQGVGWCRTPWNDFDDYWRYSPMKYIGNARTPTLIIHSEGDYRCCPEQAEQVFTALRRQRVDTEMLLLPEESHFPRRVDRQVAVWSHMLRWFDRYLKE